MNPDFLSVERLVDDLLRPCDAVFREHTGPIVLEFPPFPRAMRLDPADFVAVSTDFWATFPSPSNMPWNCATRVCSPRPTKRCSRDTEWLTPTTTGARCRLPESRPQSCRQTTPDFSVVRLLLRPGTWYEDQRERFKPFNRVVEPDEAMRSEIAAIARRIVNRGRRVFVLVNNKAEGSSPLTVMAPCRADCGCGSLNTR